MPPEVLAYIGKIGTTALSSFLTAALVAAVKFLWDIRNSISRLNEQIAVILTEHSSFKEKFHTVDKRLDRLEDHLSER